MNASFLKQGSEMNEFYLKQAQGLKASAAHSQPNFPGWFYSLDFEKYMVFLE